MKKAFIQLHIAVFLAGFTGILGKLITLNEGLIVWYRLLISAVTMWVIFSWSRRIKKISTADAAKITGVGFLAALHWVCFYGSIKYANVSVGLVCFSAIGFFTALLEPLILRRRISLRELLLGLLVMLGIYIIFHFDPRYKTGIAFGLIGAVLGAMFPVFNRQFMQRMNAETLMTWELSGGLLCLTAFMPLYFSHFPPAYMVPNITDLLWLLVLASICSVWAFQLSANALKHISAFTVNLTYNLEPLYGIALAFLLYHENQYLSYGFYIGLSIIAFSVLLQTWLLYRSHSKKAKELIVFRQQEISA